MPEQFPWIIMQFRSKVAWAKSSLTRVKHHKNCNWKLICRFTVSATQLLRTHHFDGFECNVFSLEIHFNIVWWVVRWDAISNETTIVSLANTSAGVQYIFVFCRRKKFFRTNSLRNFLIWRPFPFKLIIDASFVIFSFTFDNNSPCDNLEERHSLKDMVYPKKE